MNIKDARDVVGLAQALLEFKDGEADPLGPHTRLFQGSARLLVDRAQELGIEGRLPPLPSNEKVAGPPAKSGEVDPDASARVRDLKAELQAKSTELARLSELSSRSGSDRREAEQLFSQVMQREGKVEARERRTAEVREQILKVIGSAPLSKIEALEELINKGKI